MHGKHDIQWQGKVPDKLSQSAACSGNIWSLTKVNFSHSGQVEKNPDMFALQVESNKSGVVGIELASKVLGVDDYRHSISMAVNESS
jgi:hypothetical protein